MYQDRTPFLDENRCQPLKVVCPYSSWEAAMGKAGQQLLLRARTWGGAREGAGRPRLPRRTCEPHRRRPPLAKRHPVHVVQRVVPELGRLRRRACYAAIARALTRVLGRDDFRIVHVSIQRTHLHLLVEASDERALGRGMQAFAMAAARALNTVCRRRGRVFPQRYHATPITSPRQARNELAYVLNNWRKHRDDRGRPAMLDRYSSAISFDGWKEGAFVCPDDHEPLAVRPAATWLLGVGWRKHGLIGATVVPGAR
jgi:REP element-mobilizing transposase RayT